MYEEAQYSKAFYNRLDADYRQLIEQEGLPSVKDIDGMFTHAKSGGHLMFGYFTAGEFVYFYVSEYGFDKLVATLSSIGKGAKALDALTEAAGVSLEDLDTAFKAYMEKRIAPFENLAAKKQAGDGLLDKVSELFSPGEKEKEKEIGDTIAADSDYSLTMERIGMAVKEEKWEAAEKGLREAYDLFPDYDGQDAPLRQLATLYQRLGKEDEYWELLEQMVYWTPRELDIAIKLMNRYESAEDWPGMLEMADWALGIDPYDANLYRAFSLGLQKNR